MLPLHVVSGLRRPVAPVVAFSFGSVAICREDGAKSARRIKVGRSRGASRAKMGCSSLLGSLSNEKYHALPCRVV